jgi:hypothetical protein
VEPHSRRRDRRPHPAPACLGLRRGQMADGSALVRLTLRRFQLIYSRRPSETACARPIRSFADPWTSLLQVPRIPCYYFQIRLSDRHAGADPLKDVCKAQVTAPSLRFDPISPRSPLSHRSRDEYPPRPVRYPERSCSVDFLTAKARYHVLAHVSAVVYSRACRWFTSWLPSHLKVLYHVTTPRSRVHSPAL